MHLCTYIFNFTVYIYNFIYRVYKFRTFTAVAEA